MSTSMSIKNTVEYPDQIVKLKKFGHAPAWNQQWRVKKQGLIDIGSI